MKHIEVVAAIIRRDNEILATQRGYGPLKGGWEFPGGKIESGESHEQALIRELKEEMDADILVAGKLISVTHEYDDFSVILHCYWAELKKEHYSLLEHSDAKWLTKDNLWSVDWLPADLAVIKAIEEQM